MNKKLAVLTLLIPVFIFFLGFWKTKLREDTIKEGNLLNVIITSIDCAGVNHHSILLFKYDGKVCDVKIAQSRCGDFNVGNEIVVYYNPDSDYFLLKDDGLENENRMGMIGSVVLFGFMSYWVYNVVRQKG